MAGASGFGNAASIETQVSVSMAVAGAGGCQPGGPSAGAPDKAAGRGLRGESGVEHARIGTVGASRPQGGPKEGRRVTCCRTR
jgi:hypothetical protein